MEGVDLVAQLESSAEWNLFGWQLLPIATAAAGHEVQQWLAWTVDVFGAEGQKEMDGKKTN